MSASANFAVASTRLSFAAARAMDTSLKALIPGEIAAPSEVPRTAISATHTVSFTFELYE